MAHPDCGAPASAAGRGPSSARDIGALFRRHGQTFSASHEPGRLERRALHDISRCRTAALGGHLDVCAACGHERPSYNSCRNRHCPKCQALRQARWVQARLERALPVPHFHIVFTLPAELRPLVHRNRASLYELLLEASSASILELARDPKRLGALVGVTAVLHTWARNLSFHPHVHCIVTGGGLASDGVTWLPAAEKYLLPVKALGRLFRGKFLAGLIALHERGALSLDGALAPLADPRGFASLRDALYRKEWVVYTKAPFKSPHALFRYLGLYTHRVAISNHRLLAVDDDQIVFRTRDRKVCRLEPIEFIRRFLQHVLPRGFVKIRHYGLLAPGNVNTKLVAARDAIARCKSAKADAKARARATAVAAPPAPQTPPSWRELFRQLTGIDLGRCTLCDGPLHAVALPERFVARAPPPDSS